MVPNTTALAEAAASSHGTLRLTPIDGSADQETYVVNIALDHEPGVLTLGDLRRTAEHLSVTGAHEQAFRVWTVVETAADRVGNGALKAVASTRASNASVFAHGRSGAPAVDRRSQDRDDLISESVETALGAAVGPKYDYDQLAADRFDGMSLSAVAKKWGCSPSTVHRAEEYVTQRDDVVDMYPELLDQLMAGVDLAQLSERYDVPTKVLKWMVSTRFERRRS